jgi:hypothetical protein
MTAGEGTSGNSSKRRAPDCTPSYLYAVNVGEGVFYELRLDGVRGRSQGPRWVVRPTLRHPDRGAMLPSLRDTWGGVFILPLPRRRRRMEVGDEKNGTPPGSDARGADRGERGGVGGLHPVPQRPPRQHRDLLGYTRSRRNNRNQSKRLYRRSARRRSHPRGKRSRPYCWRRLLAWRRREPRRAGSGSHRRELGFREALRRARR